MRIILAAALALLAAGAALAQDAGPISAQRMSDVVKVIASDAFEGRSPGTPAEDRTVAYLVGQLRAMGLEPAGDGGGWAQAVPMVRFNLKPDPKVAVSAAGAEVPLRQAQEVMLMTQRPVDRVQVAAAPLVFVGYGVKAPERGWDDFKGYDLKGKVMVVLVNDPDFEAAPGDDAHGRFGGRAMTYYGRWTYKYEEAARQGALGMLIVHETKPASYGWATVKNSNANAQFDIVRPDPTKAHPLLQGWIQRDVTEKLFKDCGLDFAAQKAAAMRPDFHPVPLGCATFSADYAVDHVNTVTHNILGKLTGKTRPAETIFYTAHWDHLGVGAPDAKGDRIFNGALDNASGVGDILELARVFAKTTPRTDRTIVFMAVTAEEKGLLGSLYYASHPLYPLATTVADFNFDALDADGPAHDVSVRGSNQLTLEADLAAVAKAHGRRFSPEPDPGAGRFYRADHFSFAKFGVPGISIISGRDLIKGGRAAGDAWNADYVAHRYHQPADEWSPDMDLTGQAEDVGLGYEMGLKLANSRDWPQWTPTSEFKSLRDATAKERQ